MFDSKITAKKLIETIQSEADIAIDIPNQNYIDWLNALEQLLYREVIQEQALMLFADPGASAPLCIEDKGIRFEDIHAVYADKTQLIKSTLASGHIFPDSYYKDDNRLGLKLTDDADELKVIYFAKPELKTEDDWNMQNVMLPIEFIDLAKAKLRGEAYKLANEGELAAMWLNDYNAMLEIFKIWIAEKQPKFGI